MGALGLLNDLYRMAVMIKSNRPVPLPKRHCLRVQIRRKAIEEYQQRIRKQWQSLEARQQGQPQKSNSNEDQNSKQALQQGEEIKQEALQRLEELSLTHASQLCRLQTIDILHEALNTRNKQMTQPIEGILMKMSVNSIYWCQQFVVALFELVQKIPSKHIAFDVLRSMSQCPIVEFKDILYPLFTASNNANDCNNSQYNTSIVQILSNFLVVPPIVTQLGPTQKLICLLTRITKQTHNLPQTGYRSQLPILELVYSLCVRVNQKDLGDIVETLNASQHDWELLRILMLDCFHASGSNPNMKEVRLKYKIMQIVQVMIEFCIRHSSCQRIAQQFTYRFLPILMPVVEGDLLAIYGWSTGNNSKHAQGQLINKYELILLETTYTIINVRDELQELPALQFILLRHCSLVEQIYRHYCQLPGAEARKTKIATWICETAATFIAGGCQIGWIADFVGDVIMGAYGHYPDITLLQTVIEVGSSALLSHGRSCRLYSVLSDRQIKNKLQDLAQRFEQTKTEGKIAQMIESLLQAIQNLQKEQI